MEGKKETKKVIYVNVVVDESNELEMIGYREADTGKTTIVDLNSSEDILNYPKILGALTNGELLKITDNLERVKGCLDNQIQRETPKEQWLSIEKYAESLMLENTGTLDELMKELGLAPHTSGGDKRIDLELKLRMIKDTHVKLGEVAETVDKKEWRKTLTYATKTSEDGKKYKKLHNTLKNALTIIENDPKLLGIAYNTLAYGIEINGKLEDLAWKKDDVYWMDLDYAQIKTYITLEYGALSDNNLDTAFKAAIYNRRFHPVRDYLTKVKSFWDGKTRCDTWLINHLGAEDCPYTREVSRKVLLGAVARVFQPGIQFDTMLVLDGPQGNGKTTMIRKLGMQWYSESLKLEDIRDKTGAEKLQGNWIMEIGEMAGMKKTDMDSLKAFITSLDDKYRPPYGRTVERHLRQCILIGTVNSGDRGFLRDPTGNRRYWPVLTKQVKRDMANWRDGDEKEFVKLERASWKIDKGEIDQIWAEATLLYEKNKDDKDFLVLSPEVEKYADKIRMHYMESDPRQGQVQQYLDMLLPKNWDELSIYDRQVFAKANVNGEDGYVGTEKRERTCVSEVYHECFGKAWEDGVKIKKNDSTEIAQILRKLGWESTKTARFARYGSQLAFVRKE